MQKILLFITILAISSCANQNYDDGQINYGPLPIFDAEDSTHTYEYDAPIKEGEIDELTPFDKDAARVSRELEELQQEKETKVYKKLVPNAYDDAFNN